MNTCLRMTLLLNLSLLAPVLCRAQGYAPAEAAGKMTVAPGLAVRLVAAEPQVRQPVAIEFDDRGRLWVIQYMQYPNPAGLSRVKVDRYSRTSYDKIPEPPPRGPQGSDRITILDDTDGDGQLDRTHDFVAGLNLASGLAFGHGGVFVLQTPYLLFYPDRDRDDRPDGDPEVLLSGFGMEDAHSVANSLTWGPDGWLYGLQGSTVTAKIRGIEFQQGVWRYHPTSRRFELFCEGGGNMWGLDFDPRGNLFASTNVGPSVMLHGVQGGYYWKSWGKHGPLHNPYTFGYFDHVAQQGFRGGHVAVGGLFYEADAFPAEWRGRYIVGDLLDHSIHWHELTPRGSTFQARQAGDVLRANDTWFATSDLTLGPDGGVYVADWHDKRTAHPDPDADWDRSNGRIYAIEGAHADPHPTTAPDLAARSATELVALLDHPNTWYRRRARRILAERGLKDAAPALTRRIFDSPGVASLEALWALNGCAGLDDALVLRLLEHAESDVRAWTVRLVGDEPKPASAVVAAIIARADIETSVRVRTQMACTAQRLAADDGIALAATLAERDRPDDESDPHMPLLLWWAVERHAAEAPDVVAARFSRPESWRSDLIRSAILPRLARRFAAEGNAACDLACARLLGSAPSAEAREPLVAALEESLRGPRARNLAPGLSELLIALAAADPSDPVLTRVAARIGNASAVARARAIARNLSAAVPARTAMVELLGELGADDDRDVLLDLAVRDRSEPVRIAALQALGPFDNPAIAPALLATYQSGTPAWRTRVRALLLGRTRSARVFLNAVDRGAIAASDVTMDQLERVALLNDPDLDALVRKHWGQNRGATPEEKLAEVRRLNNDVRAATGDPARGHALFKDRCATCHRLFGEGNTIGPDLTFANRTDRAYLLVSLVDPSGVVRKEYQSYVAQTRDGRVLTGLIVEQTPDAVTLRDAKGESTRIPRAEIEALKESAASLMPESLYKELTPSQMRDLFSYLQGAGPLDRKDQP